MKKFSQLNFLKVSKEVLEFQLKTLYPLNIEKEPERTNLVFLNHDRNFSTFLTIEFLAKHGRVADIYTLSRSMFESVISMGLLSKKIIENDVDRYQNYQFIEIYKTYSHLKKLGLESTSSLSKEDFTIVKKKRDEYKKKFGEKLFTWTGKNMEDNVKLIDKHYSPTCNEDHFYEYLYCQVYRKGSQSAHASFAGLLKGVDIKEIRLPGIGTAQRFKPNEPHIIFSCFHSLIVFLSSIRFMGYLLDKNNAEEYFHKISKYIISEP